MKFLLENWSKVRRHLTQSIAGCITDSRVLNTINKHSYIMRMNIKGCSPPFFESNLCNTTSATTDNKHYAVIIISFHSPNPEGMAEQRPLCCRECLPSAGGSPLHKQKLPSDRHVGIANQLKNKIISWRK